VDRREIPDFTLGMTAWRYVRAIQKVQPQGPYLIGGHSFGGVLALKVVERLNAIGESVALLAIFDTIIYPRLSGLTADPSSAAASSPRKWWKFFKLPAKPSQMMRLPLAGLVRQQGVAQYELFALHSLVQARFARPLKPWGGRAAVFVSKGEQAKLVEATWNHLLTGPHSFIHVSGDHVSLLQRPHVTHLAPELAHEMADALAVESASQRTDTQPEINEG
jgi:thioesterase domain-containing protein